MEKYYEEQVIDNVLSWRETATGKWIPFTPASLTTALLVERNCHKTEKHRRTKAESKLNKAKDVLNA